MPASLRSSSHPYLSGNFAPINQERSLTPCTLVSGSVPPCLFGGQYVRNGSNPAQVARKNAAKDEGGDDDDASNGGERQYHWFDGDGMLSGVLFGEKGECWFVNKYLVTDVYAATRSLGLTDPMLPSISTLVSPTTPLTDLLLTILRSVLLSLITRLPILANLPLRSLSVANTSLIFHSRRALALCESGSPLEVRLPSLDTVGWFTWKIPVLRSPGSSSSSTNLIEEVGGLSDSGALLGFFKSWTTAHPRIDPITGELLLFSSSFLPPYLRYSVISPSGVPVLLSVPIPLQAPKMMHDFAATEKHTVILDLPLLLSPANLVQGRPILYYDHSLLSRFGVLPRYADGPTRWFEDEPCVVFHCANACDSFSENGEVDAVNLLCCRFKTDSLVFAAGNLPVPPSSSEDPPLLHYFRFSLSRHQTHPSHSFPLLSIPFEFPTLPAAVSTRPSRYVYGCSMRSGNFTAALGGAAKIDCLVRVDVYKLIERGLLRGEGTLGAVDTRTMQEILATSDSDDAVRVFPLPPQHFAQEATFVPSSTFSPSPTSASQAEGYLLFYVFDESQLLPSGAAPPTAQSELWILDARNMKDVVAKVRLPQRVPYGLHGTWITPAQIEEQLPDRPIRTVPPLSTPFGPMSCVLQTSYRKLEQSVEGLRKGDPVEFILHVLAVIQVVLALGAVIYAASTGPRLDAVGKAMESMRADL